MTVRHKLDSTKYRGNPRMIAQYLNQALASGEPALITEAIGDLIGAHRASEFSRKSGLERKNLYRSFTGERMPRFDTVFRALAALELELVVKPRQSSSSSSELPEPTEIGLKARKSTSD